MKNHSSFNIIYNDKIYPLHYLLESKPIKDLKDPFSICQQIIQGFTQQTLVTLDAHINLTMAMQSHPKIVLDARLAMATSGTQNQPKIVLISECNILSHCQSLQQVIPLKQQSIWLNCMPLNHIAGIMIIYRCWFNHACMLLHPGFNAEQVWHDLNNSAVTHISLVPIMLARLLAISGDTPAPLSLKVALVGGDKISPTLLQQARSLGWPIYLSYGMTEATSTVAIGKNPYKLKLLPGITAKCDAHSNLLLKGKMFAETYANSKQKVKSTHWFKTQDLAELHNNELHILGRKDISITSGGICISIEHIENLLNPAIELASSQVKDIAIGSIEHKAWGQTVAALVNGNTEELKQWVNAHWQQHGIPAHYKPRLFINCDKIPRNNLGKISRGEVQKILNKYERDIH